MRSLTVESGLLLRAGTLPLQLTLNGQDFDEPGASTIVYHHTPSMLPLYGPSHGGTRLTLAVSGVNPATAAAVTAARCRFGRAVETPATLAASARA